MREFHRLDLFESCWLRPLHCRRLQHIAQSSSYMGDRDDSQKIEQAALSYRLSKLLLYLLHQLGVAQEINCGHCHSLRRIDQSFVPC